MILTTARAARTSCERSATARSLSLFSVLILLAVALPDAAARDRRQCDFDGDGRDDFVVYTSTQSGWYILRSSDGRGQAGYWGGPDAQPVPGDYDGDRLSDACVYHSRSGNWFLFLSGTGQPSVIPWGGPGTVPLPGDFDGDGRSDLAVYHGPSACWFIMRSSDTTPSVFYWGAPGVEPVPRDYDGDGITDVAAYERARGRWHIWSSLYQGYYLSIYGGPTLDPVPADYDGDGKDDVAVYDRNSGIWHICYSSLGLAGSLAWGWPGAQPAPGYYDADDKADLAVYYPPYGLWYVLASTTLGLWPVSWGNALSEPAWLSSRQLHPDLFHYGHNYGHNYEADLVVPADFAGVEWLYQDVSRWAVTATLSVSVTKTHIILDYSKANVWVPVEGLVANPWIFIPKPDGGWYAGTFEWMRPGQTAKFRYAVAGDHIKKPQTDGFLPVPGEWYGFMVSGLVRDSRRNHYERTPVVMVQWPLD
jgi:hypothetical protein